MKKPSKTAKPLKVPSFTVTARGVADAAFTAGESRNQLVQRYAAANGKRPVLSLYNANRDAVICGFMAAALARKGDNRPADVLLPHCLDRITRYQGHGGTAKLRAGMVGRRTADEEAAYLSARVLVTRLNKDAGVTVPVKSGTGQKGKAKKGANAKKGKGKASAKVETKPTTPRIKSVDSFVDYIHSQAKAMESTFNRNAAKLNADPRVAEIGELVQLFAAKARNII